MERSLTMRYGIALTLVASVLIGAFMLMRHEISISENNGRIVNLAGMQRMLSQRIALLAQAIDNDATLDTALLDELHRAIERMAANHRVLTGPEAAHLMSPELEAHYFEPRGLNVGTNQFLMAARRFRTEAANAPSGLVGVSTSLTPMTRAAVDKLLNDLDTAVSLFEASAAEKIRALARFEFWLLMFGLVVLLLEALFIFRPAARRIASMFRAQQQQQDDLRAFGHHVSHDLQSAVATSKGLTAIAAEAVDSGDTQLAVASLHRLDAGIGRLSQLVDGVIEATCGDGRNAPASRIFLPELLAQIFDKQSTQHGFDDIKRRVLLHGNEHVVSVHAVLHQALDELIDNAIRYRDPQRSECELVITAERTDDHFAIHVSDNGLGIPERRRGALFGAFEKHHPQHSAGVGLGLYLARRSVETIGGTIDYQAKSEGSQFTIRLPREAA